jgi:hypothetical protein
MAGSDPSKMAKVLVMLSSPTRFQRVTDEMTPASVSGFHRDYWLRDEERFYEWARF